MKQSISMEPGIAYRELANAMRHLLVEREAQVRRELVEQRFLTWDEAERLASALRTLRVVLEKLVALGAPLNDDGYSVAG